MATDKTSAADGFGRANFAVLVVVALLGIAFLVRTPSASTDLGAVSPPPTEAAAEPAPTPTEITAENAPPDEPTDVTPEGLTVNAAPLESLVAGDGTAVFDVRRSTGERLRVAVPASLANGFSSTVDIENGVSLRGPAGSLAINFGSCIEDWGQTAFSWETNRVGARVFIDGTTAAVCRTAVELTARFDATEQIEDAPDLFDVRAIATGHVLDALLDDVWIDRGDCRCLPFGPMAFPDAGVVVNYTGDDTFTAVDQRDLSMRWIASYGDALPVEGPGGMYLDVTDGDLLRLDPSTGEVVWRMTKSTGERALVMHSVDETQWLVQSSFFEIDDDRAPVVRLIDVQTGEVRWEANGRSSSGWKQSDPVVIAGHVVVMDRNDDPQTGDNGRLATLQAYDIETGKLAWTADLGATKINLHEGVVESFDFEDDKGLFALSYDGVFRIDPITGEEIWRVPNDEAVFDGTSYDNNERLALTLRLDDGYMLLDPNTGEEIDGACDTLHGAEPWLTLFSEELWAPCVFVADYQNLQLWNKGFNLLGIDWPGEPDGVMIKSDYNYETGPIGEVLGTGRFEIESAPYPMPDIIVVSPDLSPTAALPISEGAVGPVTVGMSLFAAADALGHPITVDPNELPGPRCWAAFVNDDPYSPIFLVTGDGGSASMITAIDDPREPLSENGREC